MEKITALWTVLQRGKEVADPGKWKSRQITGNVLAGFAVSVANLLPLFGVPLPPFLTETAINVGASVVVTVWNAYLTTATTTKIGLPSEPVVDEPRA